MKRLFLVISLLVAISVSLSASAQTITYTSGFQVQNLDPSNDATISITFYNPNGSVAATVHDTIQAGRSKTYFPLNAVSDGFDGSVIISSDRDIRAIVNVLGNGLDYGASYGGFTAGATTVYVPLLMKANSGFNTWFRIQNTGSAATNVTVTYSDGVTASCTNLQPGAACTLQQALEPHASGWVGSAVVNASQPVAVTVIEVGPTTLFAYNGFTGGSTDVVMPLINANNAGYITGVQIMNLGSADTQVTVSYTPSLAGTACTETKTIPAGRSETFALYAFAQTVPGENCANGVKFIGSARVTGNSANQPLVAVVNQLNIAANKGAAYEGFNPATATDTVVMPLIMDRNSNYWTGFSVMNVGSAPTTVTCTFSGSTHTESQSLNPGEAMTRLQNGVIAPGYVGSATCTASSGGRIVGVVNELNSVLAGDAFLVYDAFNK
ncbi:MAG TPA: hypothetical protein VNK89_06105 [Thermoflexus sp.]|nr:hypothetical protein [Thermoflexus sp.]